MKRDTVATSALMFSTNYPDIEEGATKAFLEEVVRMVEASTAQMTPSGREDLLTLLREGMDDAALDFIQHGDRHVLISGFEVFYRHVIALFKASTHLLDQEDLVAEKLAEAPMTDGEAPYNGYRFLDSKDDKGIQVADVVAGMLGKYWTYINAVEYDAMVADMKALTAAQLDTISALKRAFDESDRVSDGFLHTVLSDDDVEKHRRFLWGIPRSR